MAEIQDMYYHGIRQQIRRVLNAMGDDRIDAGLSAFEDGEKNWSNCFFARAYRDLHLDGIGDPEVKLCNALSLTSIGGDGWNRVPVRIVYRLFNEMPGSQLTRAEMIQLIQDIESDTIHQITDHCLVSANVP